MGYRFHASAPPGEWINDPNALFFADELYHLYVQHAADAPDFKRIGWGCLSSPDLREWRWEGVVLPPEPEASCYSGSVVGGDPLRLFYTRHEPAGPWQTQRRALLGSGPAAGAAGEPFGPAGRNARDPFVWRAPEGWRMLVARPCDWTDWRADPPSEVELWGSPDLDDWALLARIGPWSPPGVMWEVPTLIDFGERQALILSLVDRRGDTAECEVRYWLGRLDDRGFAPAPGFPVEGVPMDHGPDFYAAVPNVVEGWPTRDRMVVAWASSWRTARLMSWPDGRHGGPISTPRRVGLAGERLTFRPAIDRKPDMVAPLPSEGLLRLARNDAVLEVRTAGGRVQVRRDAPGLPRFERQTPAPAALDPEAVLFIDGLLIEMFWNDVAITAVLPGEGTLAVE